MSISFRKAQITNPKNPDLDLIRPEYGFNGFKIRFRILVKKHKIWIWILPQKRSLTFFDSMFQCFAKRIRLSEKVLVRLPMPDFHTFVSYFRIFQMSVIPRVFGQQL